MTRARGFNKLASGREIVRASQRESRARTTPAKIVPSGKSSHVAVITDQRPRFARLLALGRNRAMKMNGAISIRGRSRRVPTSKGVRGAAMFDSIVCKIANHIRNTVRTVTAAMRRRPWLAPLTIVALILIW